MRIGVLVFVGCVATGCDTTREMFKPNPNPAWARPGWSPDGRLKIALVDQTKRQPSGNVTLYQANDTPPEHKVLAFVSAEGSAEDEGLIVNMILDYARHTGGSGVALLRNDRPTVKVDVNTPTIYDRPGRRIYRANVILAQQSPSEN